MIRLARLRHNAIAANAAARVAAMVVLGVTTVLVARFEGQRGVGLYAMLRVLPGLVGVLASSGLPGALPFFLSNPPDAEPDLRPTVLATAIGAGGVSALGWVALSPVLAEVFFRGEHVSVVAWAAAAVLSQLVVTTAKASCQGEGDLTGANAVMVMEEVVFLPMWALAHAAGLGTTSALVVGLVTADALTAGYGWTRLIRRGFLASRARPTLLTARRLASYGMRGQVGGMLNLLSLRLDFAILGALAGPATLGTYAVASKFAELPRVVPLAVTYVMYPVLRRKASDDAARDARQMMARAGTWTALSTIPIGICAVLLIRPLFGGQFGGAIVPAIVLLVGVAGDGFGAVASGYLYGSGRPGLNSLGMGAGVVVTVVLDAVLIPAHRAVGAAVASSCAYLTTTVVLVAIFASQSRASRFAEASPLPATPAM